MPKKIKQKIGKSVHHNHEYGRWICDCPEMWAIPKEYTHCGKCGASDCFNVRKERNIMMPPWYIENVAR